MNKRLPRRLLDRAEAVSYLRLDDDNLQPLIDTRQITPIRISGAERFDLKDLGELINAYKQLHQGENNAESRTYL